MKHARQVGDLHKAPVRLESDACDASGNSPKRKVDGGVIAEADPTADVDGLDAAAKIAIFASIAFNSRVTSDQVLAEGIRGVSPADIGYPAEMGYAIKLVAVARRVDGGVDVRVHPAMIPSEHPLAKVEGVYNAIYVTGDSVGETMFFGEGAGSLPAASAVVGDVIEIARHITAGCLGLVGCTCSDDLPVRSISDLRTRYYLRLVTAEQEEKAPTDEGGRPAQQPDGDLAAQGRGEGGAGDLQGGRRTLDSAKLRR